MSNMKKKYIVQLRHLYLTVECVGSPIVEKQGEAAYVVFREAQDTLALFPLSEVVFIFEDGKATPSRNL